MDIQKELDMALVRLQTENSNLEPGYTVSSTGVTYGEYMRNDLFDAMLAGMSPEHRAQFSDGDGKELEEKDRKPPKMASFASSSRMIYNLSKNTPDFVFEKKLSTTVGGTANLDGYLPLPNKQIFVEAKCREPYGHEAEQLISRYYRGIYTYLRENMSRIFSCVMEDVPDNPAKKIKNKMRVAFFCRKDPVAHFDIKQMICHLLAVATYALCNPDSRPITFLYLIYDPSELQTLPPAAEEELLSIYKDTCRAAEKYDFQRMFGHIVDYLNEEKGFCDDAGYIAKLKKSFRFKLCSQKDYLKRLV